MDKAGFDQAARGPVLDRTGGGTLAPMLQRRLRTPVEPRPRRVADLCWAGGALGGTALIAGGAQDFAGTGV